MEKESSLEQISENLVNNSMKRESSHLEVSVCGVQIAENASVSNCDANVAMVKEKEEKDSSTEEEEDDSSAEEVFSIDKETDLPEVDDHESKAHFNEFKPWTTEEICTLVKRIKKELPACDKNSCVHTLKEMKWEKIAFDYYSAEDCKAEFRFLLRKVKTMKTMTRVLTEVEEKISNGQINKYLILQPKTIFTKEFVKKNKGIPPVKLFSTVAEAWKNLPQKEKENYTKYSVKEKQRRLIPLHIDEPPHLPKSPFEIFYEHQCGKKAKKSLEFKRSTKVKYAALKSERKLRYIYLSAAELYTYEVQAATYQKEHPKWKIPIKRGPSKEESEMYLMEAGMPHRPPHSAVLLYYYEMIAEGIFDRVPGINRLFTALDMFRELPEEEQQVYRRRYKKVVDDYAREFPIWKEKQNEVVQMLAEKFISEEKKVTKKVVEEMPLSTETEATPSAKKKKYSSKETNTSFSTGKTSLHKTEDYQSHQRKKENEQVFPDPKKEKVREAVPIPLWELFETDLMPKPEDNLKEKIRKLEKWKAKSSELTFDQLSILQNCFKKLKNGFETSILTDVASFKKETRKRFLGTYRDLLSKLLNHDIFEDIYPIKHYPSEKYPLI
ncbi:nucleolar transcription factor 1-like isoform X2 [Homarus americanus]|uniref:nucleolar transcription factor 1-like isoform X2 n=1 Tax=Homarus americanus TaxID=6706 RepID=UPI001C43D7C0|nr:nucleolar transcription factor 1-like isoform X2 [Homarus americanus]